MKWYAIYRKETGELLSIHPRLSENYLNNMADGLDYKEFTEQPMPKSHESWDTSTKTFGLVVPPPPSWPELRAATENVLGQVEHLMVAWKSFLAAKD